MKIRDLTDRQRKKLTKKCEKELKDRNKGRSINEPLRPNDYNIGFSDGVRIILGMVDKLNE